ncbi:MAG TPA: hypothetical protein VFM39_00550 [bacterium]|nr:hypothetical protein [bacterium]
MAARQLRARTVGWGLLVATALVTALILITWKASSPLLFLLYPVMIVGVLALLAMAVLWALRHF